MFPGDVQANVAFRAGFGITCFLVCGIHCKQRPCKWSLLPNSTNSSLWLLATCKHRNGNVFN